MNILFFGCRAYAVKPREQHSKTTIDPRAWVGVNMGRSGRSPGAYEVYVVVEWNSPLLRMRATEVGGGRAIRHRRVKGG